VTAHPTEDKLTDNSIVVTTKDLLDAAPGLDDDNSVAEAFVAGARAACAVLAPELLAHGLSIYVFETEVND
jgi:hypothetical protein